MANDVGDDRAHRALGNSQQESGSFGLSFDGDADRDRMLQEIRALGHVIVALGSPGFFDHDPTLYTVARNGAVLGAVNSDGKFDLPLLGETEATYLHGAATLRELREAAKRPPSTILIVNGMRV